MGKNKKMPASQGYVFFKWSHFTFYMRFYKNVFYIYQFGKCKKKYAGVGGFCGSGKLAKGKPTAAAPAKCPDMNHNYPGGNVGTPAAKDWKACAAYCWRNARCKAFTFTVKKKRCSMKAKVLAVKNVKGKISVTRACAGKYKGYGVGAKITITWFKRSISWWWFRFGRFMLSFYSFGNGYIKIGNKKIKLTYSTYKGMPASQGWVWFRWGAYTFYLRWYKNALWAYQFGKSNKKYAGLKGFLASGKLSKGKPKGGKEARPANLAGQWRVTWSDRSVARYSIKKIGSTFKMQVLSCSWKKGCMTNKQAVIITSSKSKSYLSKAGWFQAVGLHNKYKGVPLIIYLKYINKRKLSLRWYRQSTKFKLTGVGILEAKKEKAPPAKCPDMNRKYPGSNIGTPAARDWKACAAQCYKNA